VWSAGRIPITFVCEEAHRYVPFDKSLGFEPTKRAISRIAKEGRKYGVSLCIVTQRPAELDPTILSQCNTIFSLRLTNERDQQILKAGISDAAASLLEFMTTMGTGEAITFGEGVALPTRIKFDMLPVESRPKSNTASFTANWSKDLPDQNFLHEVVSRWRQQTFSPPGSEYVSDPVPAPAPTPEAAPVVAAPAPRPPDHNAWAAAAAKPATPQPSLRKTPSSPGQQPMWPAQPPRQAQPAGQPMAPAPRAPAAPAPAPQPGAANQQSLASLIKQFRG
jgi:hypothetical protein